MRTVTRAFMFVIVAVAILGTGCKGILGGGSQDINQNLPVFSVETFEQNIIDAFAGNSVGFSYAITVDGTLVVSDGVGKGKATGDGSRDMVDTDKMHIASVSKTITAAALLRLLEDTQGVDVGSSIEPYLPSRWPRGSGVENVTFHDLLVHASGLSLPAANGRVSHNDLQQIVQTGLVDLNDPPGSQYSNVHQSLIRVMIPEILGEVANGGETDEEFRARVFGEYVQAVVFGPLGITAYLEPQADPNLYYSWPYTSGIEGIGGVGDDDWAFPNDFGAYGWYLSAIDIVKILSYIQYTEVVISSEARELMNENKYGYWNDRVGDKGLYLMKQGGWGIEVLGKIKGMQSIAAHYPGNVDAAVIVNSRPVNAYDMADIMRDAFDASFVVP